MDAFHIESRGRALWARVFTQIGEIQAQELGISLSKALQKGGFQFVALDLEHCPGLSSAGFGFLVKLQTMLTTRGRRLFLVNPSEDVLNELALRDLGEFFAVLDGTDEEADSEFDLYASS